MPKSTSNRLTVLTMMLVGAFIYWTWEATLISFVSVRKTKLPVRTLQDVLEKSNIKVREIIYVILLNKLMIDPESVFHEYQFSFQIYIRKGTAYVDDFRYAKEPYKQELFKNRIEPYLIKGSLVFKHINHKVTAL